VWRKDRLDELDRILSLRGDPTVGPQIALLKEILLGGHVIDPRSKESVSDQKQKCHYPGPATSSTPPICMPSPAIEVTKIAGKDFAWQIGTVRCYRGNPGETSLAQEWRSLTEGGSSTKKRKFLMDGAYNAWRELSEAPREGDRADPQPGISSGSPSPGSKPTTSSQARRGSGTRWPASNAILISDRKLMEEKTRHPARPDEVEWLPGV